jgi:hypothetical protein
MRLFDYFEQRQTLNTREFAEAIQLLESFVFRRAILGEQARNYWQVFAGLAYRIDPAKPLEGLKVGLARQLGSYRFPTDDEFRRALEEGNLYSKRVCWDLLERLENYDSKERTDTSDYSIEHVMPQNENLHPAWREMLGDSWREIQRLWLHRLGNLTLTGYNSTYSDRPFTDKKTIPGGFAESSVRLNKFIREQEKWTSKEMEERGKELAARSLTIWPSLIVDPALIAAAEKAEMQELARHRDIEKVPMTARAKELFYALRPHIQEIAQWKFFVNAVHQGGVLFSISTLDDIAKALPLVRQAHEVEVA